MNPIRFNLKKNEFEDPLILLVYRYKGKKLVMSTQLNVPEKHWDKTQMRVKPSFGFLDYQFYNVTLDGWRSAVEQARNHFMLKDYIPSMFEMKKMIEDNLKGAKKKSSDQSFIKYLDDFIERKTGILAKSGLNNYKQAKAALLKFSQKRDIEFNDLTVRFYEGFITFMFEEMDYSPNQANKIIKKMTTVLNEASNIGINKNFQYRLPACKVAAVEALYKFYLTKEEILKIRDVELSFSPRLDRVRDWFMIGIRSGQQFSDFMGITMYDITSVNGEKMIYLQRRKNAIPVYIPIHQDVHNIIAKYNGFPKIISNTKFNVYIKEVCQIAKINTEVITYYKHKGRDNRRLKFKKVDQISSLVCRRSYATNQLKNGANPYYVMPITGHKLLKTFLDYVCLTPSEIAELLAKQSFAIDV